MGRPAKNYCEYFSHDREMRNHRKIKAIRTKFTISGYGIWCMLLEYLTGIDGNVFEYNETELELMAGDFGVSVTEIREVVDYCLKLELFFNKNGFIHSKSLDERLEFVYEKRNRQKELSEKQRRMNGKFCDTITEPTDITVTEKPYSKVKESKVKERKVKERKEKVSTTIVVDTKKKNLESEDEADSEKKRKKIFRCKKRKRTLLGGSGCGMV